MLPVADLTRAVAHYEGLGFEVTTYDGGSAYALANRDDVWLHLGQVDGYSGERSVVSVYLYVEDAAALAEEWGDGPPGATDYGLREGHHLDPDGNLLRYGSPLD
mgnify:CR=1 FL=1